ncbi:MAG: hypothetical protein MN733_28325 [Nitrososphaera sp.]|nr:hypothetical protein [Nitrososphaera sp.]
MIRAATVLIPHRYLLGEDWALRLRPTLHHSDAWPEIVFQGNTKKCLTHLREGVCDLAILSAPPASGLSASECDNFISHRLPVPDRAVLVVPVDHPLVERSSSIGARRVIDSSLLLEYLVRITRG